MRPMGRSPSVAVVENLGGDDHASTVFGLSGASMRAPHRFTEAPPPERRALRNLDLHCRSRSSCGTHKNCPCGGCGTRPPRSGWRAAALGDLSVGAPRLRCAGCARPRVAVHGPLGFVFPR